MRYLKTWHGVDYRGEGEWGMDEDEDRVTPSLLTGAGQTRLHSESGSAGPSRRALRALVGIYSSCVGANGGFQVHFPRVPLR